MSRLQTSTSGRKPPPLERLDAKTLRAKVNDALECLGIPHSNRQAVSNIRRRVFIEQEDLDEDRHDDVLP